MDPGDARPYLKPGSRPSFRKGVVDEVWENAKGPDGLVRDPNTGEVIHWTPGDPRAGVWDMGHIPEQKYHEKWQEYVNGEMTPKEFRDWYNDPSNYRPELPSNNRGRTYE
ncbi:MAG: HNH/ENDO VII family nuclease [Actinobacteria bacterium]|nr:HNH/ENDO VII family nuclease [Actinomycetota bacterium]